jgi:hypothetical protein
MIHSGQAIAAAVMVYVIVILSVVIGRVIYVFGRSIEAKKTLCEVPWKIEKRRRVQIVVGEALGESGVVLAGRANRKALLLYLGDRKSAHRPRPVVTTLSIERCLPVIAWPRTEDKNV